MADLLIDAGGRIEEIPSEDREKMNLLVSFGPATDASRHGLVLSGHMDCVPALEEGWTSDPFVLTDRGDRWVSRGASDMKGFLALAMDAVMRLDKSRLRAPLMLLFTYDEEVGTLGAKRFVEMRRREGDLPRAVIIGEPTSLRVVRMHKGHVKARVVITGKSAHSGYPHLGVNAIELGARAVSALGALRVELEREEAPNRQHFGDVPFVPLNIGTIRGGSAINVVPDRCVVELGLRPMPGSDVASLISRVENAVRRAVHDAPADVKVLSNSPPLLLDENAFVHRELCRLVGQNDTQSVNFATDAGWFQELDVDCVLFGPGSIEDAHRPNEFMPKAEFERAAEILDQAIETFCIEAPQRG